MSQESTPNDTPESAAPNPLQADSHAIRPGEAPTVESPAPAFPSARELQRKGEAEAVAVLQRNGAAPKRKSKEGKPETFSQGDETWEWSEAGVYWQKSDSPKKRLCDPLYVEARTRDDADGNHGLLLRWRSKTGVAHEWRMPAALLYGEGTEAVRILAEGGLHMARDLSSIRKLLDYIHLRKPERVLRTVDRPGWYRGAYVTPSGAIGSPPGEQVVFAPPPGAKAAGVDCSQSGTPEEWRDTIGALAAGNSRLVLAISHNLAGPLLDIAGENEGGGIHFVGKSSSGKSTGLRVGASVMGNPRKSMQSWCATANGLEAMAALHNDQTLILDEISQAENGQAGPAIYRVMNGQGKGRATQHGTAQESAAWRCNLLSSGEEGLADIEAGAGRKAKAGQEVRLANIPAEAGHGIFEALHGHEPAALANKLRELTNRYHGAVGRRWLELLVENRGEELRETIAQGVRDFVNEAAPPGSEAQVIRVARRFGLAAVAGELATAWGLTGWKQDEAEDACKRCFAAWLADFGAGSHEEQRILEQARGFMEQHLSRFARFDATEIDTPNLAGFIRQQGERKELLVLRKPFAEEVAKGFRKAAVIEVLKKHRILLPGKEEAAQRVKLKAFGEGTHGVYVLAFPEDGTA